MRSVDRSARKLVPHRPSDAERLLEASSRIPIVTVGEKSVLLQFDYSDIQTEMSKSDPLYLVTPYTRDIVQFINFVPSPRAIVMLGLGGGAVVKWCLHTFPDADVTVVEINEHVIRLREIFCIPPDNQQFRVLCAEGADYLASTPHQSDALIVDAFDHEGQPPQLCTQMFYDDCFRVLMRDGVLVVNVCDLDQNMVQTLIERIRRSFGSQVHVLEEVLGNKILFAVKRMSRAIYHPAFGRSCLKA